MQPLGRAYFTAVYSSYVPGGTSWYLRYRRYLPTVGRYLRYAALGTVGTEHVEHVSTIKKSHTDDWGRRGKGLHLAASTRGGGIMIWLSCRRIKSRLLPASFQLESFYQIPGPSRVYKPA